MARTTSSRRRRRSAPRSWWGRTIAPRSSKNAPCGSTSHAPRPPRPRSPIAETIAYPCVVKPIDLSGSRGVIRADDPPSFASAFRRVAAIVRSPELCPPDGEPQRILVEDFIPGREVALEGLLRGGGLEVLAIFDKPDPLDGPFFEETLYVTPSRLPPHERDAVVAAVRGATRALGLSEGPIHA
ncbi:MAG: ATP-grasp domain-containing protein, partial [Chloroflexi bacterium]|nr:ATP-grasp domain-containing protein [Chloroflexota bacterium]